MQFEAVYYEPAALDYPLGIQLRQTFQSIPWHAIDSHNRIPEMTARPNKAFAAMKRCLIIGTRKTHRYVENHKISDYLVPFTSSGCTAMCLYCYLVCNYNKCAYLRLFVNREQMLQKLIKTANESGSPMTFEIGSNSDLVLENTITHNLEWVIPAFAKEGRGFLTFPTKFSDVTPLLHLRHDGKTLFRMSVNPQTIITKIERGTAPLSARIQAANDMCAAGYPVGLLIAPVILLEGWEALYSELLDTLEAGLTQQVQKQMTIEIIFMTYSYIHRAINSEAFPKAPDLYDPKLMTGRGHGKYSYHPQAREPATQFFTAEIRRRFPKAKLIYIV